jgi:aldose 1-epimerase
MPDVSKAMIEGRTVFTLASGTGDSAEVDLRGGKILGLALCAPDGSGAMPVLAHEEKATGEPRFAGWLLFPWNDRIPLGRWSFEGRSGQLSPNEPEDGSAIHGFLHRRMLTPMRWGSESGEAFLELKADIAPGEEPGWPFALILHVTYRLVRGSFTMDFCVENRGNERAPFALGWHPYFRLEGSSREWTLEHRGELQVPVGPDLLPLGGMAPVEGTDVDFRKGRSLGGAALDIALTAPPDGRWELRSPRGACLGFEADPSLFGFTQVYTPPDRLSVALEPISSPTDAFNRAGLGLHVLAGGESVRGSIRVDRIR